jgi:hypothetical protein
MAPKTSQGLPALPYPSDFPQIMDVAGNLLTFASAALSPAAGAAVLWPGNEVSWDVPPGGLLYVRVVSQVPHGNPTCWNQFSTANLGLGVLRCISAMEPDGGAPPWADRTADAEQMLLDAYALLQAAMELPGEFKIVNPNWVSLGPQGGVAGGEWTLPVATVD